MGKLFEVRYVAVASDYDGTLASQGKVSDATLATLKRLRLSGRRLVLVTGRELDDLLSVFPEISLFDRVVAENGGLLYTPSTLEQRPLGDAPPKRLVDELRRRGVDPLSVGRVIVASWEPHQDTVLEAIHELGLEHQVIFNKGAVMVLPPGINKATGLSAALAELGLSAHNTVGIGDAENDNAFLASCEASVAVANALAGIQERADLVTGGRAGKGVAEVAEALLADDLASLEPELARHHIVLGTLADGSEITVAPYRVNAIVAGPSSSGKSTMVRGLLERLGDAGYQFCLIDPEGDYEGFDAGAGLGDEGRVPTVEEVLGLLGEPSTSTIVNLLGLALEDRPGFYETLLPRLAELRARTGRPHWIVVDEAHHLLPPGRDTAGLAGPGDGGGLVLVTVHPARVAPAALSYLNTAIVVGESADATLGELADALGWPRPELGPVQLTAGQAVAWCEDQAPVRFEMAATRSDSRRHRRKYAQGNLGQDRWFTFRGPADRLNLSAHNLLQFMELGEGVDDDTWVHHLHQGEYSSWFARCIKDRGLAEHAARVEEDHGLSPAESRSSIRTAIEERYTGPA